MIKDIDKILKNLHIEKEGRYENHFYIIDLEDSNEYAKMYSKLDKYAINLEEPNFGKNTNNSTVNIINYFSYSYDDMDYTIFLFARFDSGTYYIKIGATE